MSTRPKKTLKEMIENQILNEARCHYTQFDLYGYPRELHIHQMEFFPGLRELAIPEPQIYTYSEEAIEYASVLKVARVPVEHMRYGMQVFDEVLNFDIPVADARKVNKTVYIDLKGALRGMGY